MMTVSAGRPAIELATACYNADLSLLLYGRHGVGKSALLDAAAEELGIECVVYDLSLMEPPDLVGLPCRRKGRTVYAPPASLPTSGKGFLVFEELNRAPSYMRAPCLQLLTARRLNGYALPRGWLPVAAINPPDGGYEVSELDPALLSRFVKALVEPDRDCWLAWARQEGLYPDVIAYVETDRSIFKAPESNPRAWTYVSKLLSAPGNAGTRRQTLRTAVSGLVGEERQASFFRFLKDRIRPLDADEVLDAYSEHRERVRAWVKEEGKLDLVQGTLWSVMTLLQSEHLFESVKADRQRWQNLGRFLKDLPGDLREEADSFFQKHGYPVPKLRGNLK
jgi:MoxR-like ATPase